ncbi:unnamed protein product [Microthlaspi erraticum]|uniref:t-SNARE coiled-coil homology domain-containing protein n=1 Tax=Microthlaspi erraticum TaxID=1685480 RepID=A0A6D2LL37_9BRAS|nr:unnamed protein product [Microthlaspi erraticum]
MFLGAAMIQLCQIFRILSLSDFLLGHLTANSRHRNGEIDDLTEEFHGEVADLRNQVKEHHTELTGRMDSMDNKFSELNANMSRISETLAQLVAQR